MRFAADLHLHSRYSRATSRTADLEGYHRWARVKGIRVVGTGDFTHPGWFSELSSKLVESDGLYALREPPRGSPLEGAEPADTPVHFMLTAEISSIYKKNGLVRKVHSLIGVPTLEDARRVGVRLAAIGNVSSDGRPILGLDPRDLLSLLLECSPDAFLIPAHIWTPWFSLFGSKSGFDRIEECFEELTPHIFALETGLSSDPLMNRRWSALDRYRLVSNSDAHSPGNLGREANVFDAEPSWRGIVDALRTGNGFLGTLEFYPEEGKYHFDGHRKCGVCMDPGQTLKAGGKCPVCGTPVTVGVLHRVLALADRDTALPPRPSEGFRSLIPLPELLSELAGTGPGSRAVGALYARIIGAFGSEYAFLLDAPLEDIERSQGALLTEAVRRMREGRIDARPGYDGEFGVIRVFDDSTLSRLRGQDELFPAAPRARKKKEQVSLARVEPAGRASAANAARASAANAARASAARAAESRDSSRRAEPSPAADLTSLDTEQHAIVESAPPRSLVVAGPGTGKTRLLAGWIARMSRERCAMPGTRPGRILALTFTNRAAGELKDRVALLVPEARGPEARGQILAATFHSFCWSILREHDSVLLTVYSPAHRTDLLALIMPAMTPAEVKLLAARMERCWEGMERPDPPLRSAMDTYEAELRRIGGADISSLVGRLVETLKEDALLLAELRRRFPVIAVDELQDINMPQYELLMLPCETAEAVLCIGDPDQAIYGFRGSDRELFFRFRTETGALSFTLSRNYRSTGMIVAAAGALIAAGRTPGVPPLTSPRESGPKIPIFSAADPDEEGRFIASAIRDLVGGVDSVSVDAARSRGHGSLAFSDIAVLFRTRAVRDALLPSLAAAGLPLTFGTGTPLAEEEPFHSLIAALRLVVNPADRLSLHTLRVHHAAHRPPGSVDHFLARSAALVVKSSAEGIGAVIDEILDTFVHFDRSILEVEIGEEAIRESAAEHGGDLPGFLAHVSLCARESEGPRNAQKVSLLTFHAAKGLEFPVVFIAGAEEGITPLGDNLAEERRLFYVAVTRARDLLHISHCRRRRTYGRLEETAPSRYLSEIPRECRADAVPRMPHRNRQLTLFN